MTVVIVSAGSVSRVPTSFSIPIAAVNRFNSFATTADRTEGYIFETLLAYISTRLAWYTKSNRVLGIRIDRNKYTQTANRITVRTIVQITYWVSFIHNKVDMIPYPRVGTAANIGALPLTSLFPGIGVVNYGETVHGNSILIDENELRMYGYRNLNPLYPTDGRPLLASLLFLIADKAGKTDSSPMESVTEIRRLYNGVAQVINVVFSTISQRVAITEKQFDFSSFLKFSIFWSQDFTGDESDPQSIRILNQ